MYDLFLVNGLCPDFSDNQMKKLNVGIKDGKIVYIGTEMMEAETVIDCEGKVVSPGFVDFHMHEEILKVENYKYVISKMMLEQGVTTAVGGNCGNLRQPVAEFRKFIESEGGSPVNYILMAGYNTCREALGIGRYEAATMEQQAVMQEMLKKELADGAWGISFGLEYHPGITYEEMLSAAEASDDPNHIRSAHYRDECRPDNGTGAVEEMIQFAADIKQKFQISHLSSCAALGIMDKTLAMINKAMDENPKLGYDTYPYNAFSTRIGTAVFDEGCFEAWGKTYSDVMLAGEPYIGVYCTEEIFEDARKNYPDTLAVAFVMNEDEIRDAIVNEKGIVASDGLITLGKGHPRAAGTFTRVLGKYVREEKALPLIEALRKITLAPADRLGLKTKGRLEEGCDADITIFDPETIIDKADFTHIERPEGIEYVIIGGEIAVKQGENINERLGRFIPYNKQ